MAAPQRAGKSPEIKLEEILAEEDEELGDVTLQGANLNIDNILEDSELSEDDR